MANSAVLKPDPAGDPGTKRPKGLKLEAKSQRREFPKVKASGGVSRQA